MPALLDHDLLVIKQKAKLIELTNEYRIRDEHGTDVGLIRQEGQSKGRKLLRLVSSVDQFLSVSLTVYDADDRPVVGLRRPAALLKSRIEVTDGEGALVGRIAQQNVLGKIRFALEDAGGAALGEIRAENWRAWDFSVVAPAPFWWGEMRRIRRILPTRTADRARERAGYHGYGTLTRG